MTKASTAGIKPVVPVISASVPVRPIAKTSSTSAHQISSENKDVDHADTKLNDAGEPLPVSSEAKGKRPEDKVDENVQNTSVAKTSEKRARPGNLNLQMSKGNSVENAASQEKTTKITGDQKSHSQTFSQPTTPASNPAHSSAPNSGRKIQSRTIQVTETSTHEASSPAAALPQAIGQISRRPSLTSLNRPETPMSEKVSDSVSYTTTSISRANSPPPSVIGSAPTRRLTKNQQKKERQERARKAEDTADPEPVLPSEQPVVQAPIIGRKKKTKKNKEMTGTTADSTPTVTRPPSPETQENTAKVPPAPQPEDIGTGPKESNKQVKLPPIAPLKSESSSSTAALPSVPKSEQGNHVQSTPASIFADLRASGELSQAAIEILFKPVTSTSHRLDQILDPQAILNSKLDNLNLDQIACLDNDEPVVMAVGMNMAVIIMPDRRCLRGFTLAQANRYRELHLKGARASLSTPKENQDLIDDLMPLHESSSERVQIPALGSADSLIPAQLNNRFAEPLTTQTVPSTSVSMRLDALPNTPLARGDKPTPTVEEAERALAAERKNTEALEKKFNALLKKNKRILVGSGN